MRERKKIVPPFLFNIFTPLFPLAFSSSPFVHFSPKSLQIERQGDREKSPPKLVTQPFPLFLGGNGLSPLPSPGHSNEDVPSLFQFF